MDENIEPTGSTGMDRRTLIKRAGIVGAGVAVWSAPSVTSLASRAYAAGSVSTSCKSCGSYQQCGSTGPLGVCSCYSNHSGSGCTCGQDDFCGNVQPCSSQADCASGTQCVESACGPVCIEQCTNTTGASNPGGHGLTTTGKTL